MSMTIKGAIKQIRTFMVVHEIHESPLGDALTMAIDALKEKAERENPAPLTIEELRQINGEPLWLDIYGWRVVYGTSMFRGSEYLELTMDLAIPLDGYGKKWFAYRHKPKEEHHEN